MRVAIVVPRFGPGVIGGAERHGAELAAELAGSGYAVELLSAHDGPGVATADHRGVPVRLFPTAPPDPRRAALVHQVRAGVRLSRREELTWLLGDGDAPGIEAHLADSDVDAVLALPYLAATTWRAAAGAGRDRFVLVPCLHDEAYARLGVVAELFGRAHAVLYNTEAEGGLIRRMFGPRARAGLGAMGFGAGSFSSLSSSPASNGRGVAGVADLDIGDPADGPYVLYIGRWDLGKGVAEVCDHARRTPVRLVLTGKGADAPRRGRWVHPVGVVDEPTKARLLDGALALAQPSRNESLSIVAMEAWLRETPVLVSSFCDPTRQHVEASGGGFHYAGQSGFARAVRALVETPGLRSELGAAGRRYVETEWSWDAVLDRTRRHLDSWFG